MTAVEDKREAFMAGIKWAVRFLQVSANVMNDQSAKSALNATQGHLTKLLGDYYRGVEVGHTGWVPKRLSEMK